MENSSPSSHNYDQGVPLRLELTLYFSPLGNLPCISVFSRCGVECWRLRRLAGEFSEGDQNDRGSDRKLPPSKTAASAAIEAALLLQVRKRHSPSYSTGTSALFFKPGSKSYNTQKPAVALRQRAKPRVFLARTRNFQYIFPAHPTTPTR